MDQAVEHVMAGFAVLPVHADVADGVRVLRALGPRLVTLSNGATSVAEALFTRAGIREAFDRLLPVEDAGAWKPAAAAYRYAATACGVPPDQLMLIAVHPWDIDGADRAGLRTAWINRTGGPYPAYFRRPGLEASSLVDLAGQLRDGVAGP